MKILADYNKAPDTGNDPQVVDKWLDERGRLLEGFQWARRCCPERFHEFDVTTAGRRLRFQIVGNALAAAALEVTLTGMTLTCTAPCRGRRRSR